MSEAENDAAWVAKLIITERDATITALRQEVEEARALCDRLKLEAQIHAGEARTTNSTIYEIYQVLSGAKGESGNWNGAEPARRFVQRVKEVLEPFAKVATAFAEAEDDTFETWRDCHEPAVKEASKLRHFRAARALHDELKDMK